MLKFYKIYQEKKEFADLRMTYGVFNPGKTNRAWTLGIFEENFH